MRTVADRLGTLADMAEHPGVRTSALTRSILAPNPGPMTLDGTNSYVIGTGERTVVVDPGPLDEGHLQALTARPIELVLITHHHHDHTEASAEFARRTGAAVRAWDPAFCIDGEPLRDGEEITAAGVRIRVVHTPGHTPDSVSFHLPDDGEAGAVLTGDTILGRGTTVIIPPDGGVGDFLASLDRLEAFGPAQVLPAHGPVLPALDAVCRQYREHRLERLEEIRRALAQAGRAASDDAETITAVTDAVYGDVPENVRFAAEKSVRAQLIHLAGGA